MTRVVVAEVPENAGRNLDVEISILGPDVSFVHYSCDGDADALIAACREADVILTPHVAFYSDASILENRRESASNIRNFLDGEHSKVRKYIHHATD
jgi:lactate dehydrogenase-like 2-hydroxyacid dehydrogenase